MIMDKAYTKVLSIIVVLFISGCTSENTYKSFEFIHTSGDTKFYKDNQLVSSSTVLEIIDTDNMSVKLYPEYLSSWIDCFVEENLIVFSSTNLQVNVVELDEHGNAVDSFLVCTGDELRIDPTIFKIKDRYFITCTRIKGAINNGNPVHENGVYTIELYTSSDLEHWEKVTDVISANENLEDVDVLVCEDEIYVVYEQERYDHGPSDIMLISSKDLGDTWSEATALIKGNADNEPAKLLFENGSFYLFYSSDKEDKGASYDGAKAYVNIYNTDFILQEERLLPTTVEMNMILYDVLIQDDNLVLLYAANYMQNRELHIDLIDKFFR